MIDVDALAQEIRRVDGNHSLGAGALAEALMPFLSAAAPSPSASEAQVRVKALETLASARKKHVNAVAAYNSRLKLANEERARGNWSIRLDTEYREMHDAQSEFIRVAQSVADEALSTPEQGETEAPVPHLRGDEAEWIKTCTAKISNAIGGGSELFTRHGDEFRLDIDFVCKRISEQRERMIAALGNAVRAQRKADGIELSARFVETRRDDYVKEFGFYDGETGVTEFSGNGNEYVYELEEIIEGIRALASEGEANG